MILSKKGEEYAFFITGDEGIHMALRNADRAMAIEKESLIENNDC